MSMQYAQPLICDTRKNTSSARRVPSGPFLMVSDTPTRPMKALDDSLWYGRRAVCWLDDMAGSLDESVV
ncbi:hypothetical protein D3C86_2099790 [compost metagenome]